MAIKFKELKKYISRVARISICFDDGNYDNYHTTPEWNDNKFVVDESFYEVDMDKLLEEVN